LDDVRDPRAVEWADALAVVTGLDRRKLLDARSARLAASGGAGAPSVRAAPAFHVPDAQAQAVCSELRRMKNRPIALSPQGRRQFERVRGS
jgi:hypothetical protein